MAKMENISDGAELRRVAEAALETSPREEDDLSGISPEATASLIHELRVHQVELNMQNQELRRVLGELETTRDRYSHLYDFAPVGYFTISDKGVILEANLTAVAMLGVERGILAGSSFHDYITMDDQDIFYKHRQQFSETEAPRSCELRLVKRDGHDFYARLECSVITGRGDDVKQIRMAVSDVTERKQAEEALLKAHYEVEEKVVERTAELAKMNHELTGEIDERKRAEEALRRTQLMLARTERIAHIGSWEWNIATDSVIWSEELFRIFQLDPEGGAPGWSEHAALYHPEDMIFLRRAVERAVSDGTSYELELRALRKDGETRVCLARGFPEMDLHGGVVRLFGCLQDIMDFKAAEQALLQSEKKLQSSLIHARKMESIATLTGGIAHDYNNLMSIVMGNLSMAMEEVAPGSLFADFLSEANTASHKVRDLTHELMSLSKGGDPVKELGSLETLLKNIESLIPVDSDISLEKSISKDLWPVSYDQHKMGAVFRNVVTNAVEAMPDGGTLNVKAENLRVADQDTHPGLPLKPGDYVHIAIEDQGVGITEENLSKIFDPYFSTKDMGVQKGMGLGLATSYAIVHKHGGHIAVDSTPGVGTTVNIYLSATAAESKAQSAARPEPGPQSTIANQQSSIQRILVMDDEEMLRHLAEQMLKRLGYAVETVKDGIEAIEAYKKKKDSGEPFDAVILDLTIKGGMGGEQTIKELIKIDPDVKAIVCSGYFNDPVLTRHAEYGFQGAMAKPYQKSDIERVLKEVLG